MSPSQIVYSIVALENTKKKKNEKKLHGSSEWIKRESAEMSGFISVTNICIQNNPKRTGRDPKKTKKKSCLRLRFSSLEGDRNGK